LAEGYYRGTCVEKYVTLMCRYIGVTVSISFPGTIKTKIGYRFFNIRSITKGEYQQIEDEFGIYIEGGEHVVEKNEKVFYCITRDGELRSYPKFFRTENVTMLSFDPKINWQRDIIEAHVLKNM